MSSALITYLHSNLTTTIHIRFKLNPTTYSTQSACPSYHFRPNFVTISTDTLSVLRRSLSPTTLDCTCHATRSNKRLTTKAQACIVLNSGASSQNARDPDRSADIIQRLQTSACFFVDHKLRYRASVATLCSLKIHLSQSAVAFQSASRRDRDHLARIRTPRFPRWPGPKWECVVVYEQTDITHSVRLLDDGGIYPG